MSRATFLAAFKKAAIDWRAETLGGAVGEDGNFEIELQQLLADASESWGEVTERITYATEWFNKFKKMVEEQPDIDHIVLWLRHDDLDDAIDMQQYFIDRLYEAELEEEVTAASLTAKFRSDLAELDRLESEAEVLEAKVAAERLHLQEG
jgi:hypothetical protein